MLNQKRLKEVLIYEPTSGLFSRVGPGKAKVGSLDGTGYIHIGVDGKVYKAHRLAFLFMTGSFPVEVDHIDGQSNNNKWNNLRGVTRSGNMMNAKRPNTNTSGVVGVHWNKIDRKWKAQIQVEGKYKYLGPFAAFFDAVCARKSAEDQLGFHINHGRD